MLFCASERDGDTSQPEGVYKQRDSTEGKFGLPLWLIYFNRYVRAWLHKEEGYTEYDIYHEQE